MIKLFTMLHISGMNLYFNILIITKKKKCYTQLVSLYIKF